MNKVKKVLIVALFMVILVTNISPLGKPPGWNGTEPVSETVLDEEV